MRRRTPLPAERSSSFDPGPLYQTGRSASSFRLAEARRHRDERARHLVDRDRAEALAELEEFAAARRQRVEHEAGAAAEDVATRVQDDRRHGRALQDELGEAVRELTLDRAQPAAVVRAGYRMDVGESREQRA